MKFEDAFRKLEGHNGGPPIDGCERDGSGEEPTRRQSRIRELKHNLLRRAFREARGYEVILLIQWRKAYNDHISGFDQHRIREAQIMDALSEARCVRMLNYQADQDGLKTRFSTKLPKDFIRWDFETMFQGTGYSVEKAIILPTSPNPRR